MSSLLLQENRRRKEAMEALVSDIAHPGNENDEDNITSSIRIALERGWNSQSKGSNFIDVLNETKKKKLIEIDRICFRHYSDFLESINHLTEMKESAHTLTQLIAVVDKDFSTIGALFHKVVYCFI
jgi:hypothetical protein